MIRRIFSFLGALFSNFKDIGAGLDGFLFHGKARHKEGTPYIPRPKVRAGLGVSKAVRDYNFRMKVRRRRRRAALAAVTRQEQLFAGIYRKG